MGHYKVATGSCNRATKGAAQTLLAKAYLYQKKFSECEAVSGEVINSGDYTLTPDYKDIWSGESEHIDNGTIFDIVYTSSDIGRHIAYWAVSQRSRNWKGWGLNCPSADLLSEFEQEPGDPRIIWTFQFNGDISEGRVVNNEGYDNPDLMHCRKAWNALSKDPANGNFGKNFKVLRYADVLLMYAEAANENGNSAGALEKLNMVRKRARESSVTDPEREFINYTLPDLPTDQRVPDVATGDKDELRNAIWHERRLEFATEGNRFFELVRQGRAGEVMRSYESRGGKQGYGRNFDDEKNVRWPIPQVDIDQTLGVLTQNPKY
ncbi:MAG: RagB/SusD family nutrient uptake outer membrane protein [Bacteroidales bacterium]